MVFHEGIRVLTAVDVNFEVLQLPLTSDKPKSPVGQGSLAAHYRALSASEVGSAHLWRGAAEALGG